jgi:hypothetical protein
MPLTPANSDPDNRASTAKVDTMNVESTHHFAPDLLAGMSVVRNIASPSPLSQVPQTLVTQGLPRAGVKGVASGISDIGPYEAPERQPTDFSYFGRDETMSVTSEESDGNMSIPHDDPAPSVAVDQESSASPITEIAQASGTGQDEATSTADLSTDVPPVIQAQLEAWYLRYGRVAPPCATTAFAHNLYKSSKAGAVAHWVHKSGEKLQVSMYRLENVQLNKTGMPRQKIIVAQGPTHGPFIVCYTTQKNMEVSGIAYRIWQGVGGEDKNGFELQPSVFKVFGMAKKATSKAKRPTETASIHKRGSKGNQIYQANGTPKSSGATRGRAKASGSTTSTNELTPRNTWKQQSNYEVRTSKRLKLNEESPGNYSKLLAASPSSAEPTLSYNQGEQPSYNRLWMNSSPIDSNQLFEHIQNNAVFLFYSKKSPQPRARLFTGCNTIQKLFAQALAGDVFDDETTAGKVLSIRVAGQQKAKAVVEDDEQDFDDIVDTLKGAACWVSKNGLIEGSCTVEVRVKS